MSLFALLFVLVVIGIVLYCINVYVPLDSKIRQLINAVVVLFLVIWLLQAFGLLDFLKTVRIGK